MNKINVRFFVSARTLFLTTQCVDWHGLVMFSPSSSPPPSASSCPPQPHPAIWRDGAPTVTAIIIESKRFIKNGSRSVSPMKEFKSQGDESNDYERLLQNLPTSGINE